MPTPETAPARTAIRRLPDHLANQIAAGEVVERPASVVKELLENSLDAGARQITVSLTQGGMRSIRVQDDGQGIPAAELALALLPHATSKIATAEDLAAIASMGFRGEALASIGSVACLELISRPPDAEQGARIACQPGAVPDEIRPAAHPVGTTVTVADLFHNVPARRRFLRSERTEYRHCEEVVRRIALSRFDVAITLRHNRRTVYSLPAVAAEGRRRRLARLCGKAFAEQALALDFSRSGLRLHGWIAPPEAARAQADLQYFFVNGRIIRDRVLGHALRQAFAGRLPDGRHPAWLLYLEMDPAEVDVNVHPAKHEVRFRQTRWVHDFLVHCLERALDPAATESGAYAPEPLAWHKPAVGAAPAGVPRARVEADGVAEVPDAYESPEPPSTADMVRRLGEYLLFVHRERTGVASLGRLIEWHVCQALSAGEAESRPWLIPEAVRLEGIAEETVTPLLGELSALGFDLGWAGPGTLLLRQSPRALTPVDVVALLPVLLARLAACPTERWGPETAALAARYPHPDWSAQQWLELLARHGFPAPAVRWLTATDLQRLFETS